MPKLIYSIFIEIMSKVIYHITIEHIYYLINRQCYFTLKADGYYNINSDYEYESLNNKKYIFNVNDSNLNIQERIFDLADKMQIDYPIIFKEEVNIKNISNILNTYLDFYDNFDGLTIPKFYLKISKLNFIEVLKFLSNYFPSNGFPNDGWVIIPEENIYIAKLKPLHHLTIDLKYQNNKFFANKWINVDAKKNKQLKNGSIYRCYWENNNWLAKEERTDKKFGNNINIIETITNYLSKGYNFDNINNYKQTIYYEHNKFINQKEIINYFNFMKLFLQNWIIKNCDICDKLKLLDVGCGKRASYERLSEIGIKNIVGVDSDPVCIFKSIICSRNNSYIWLDINYDWNIRGQVSKFGNIWMDSQIFKLYYLHSIFDIILFNFSIFYCKSNNYETLISNINKVSKKGTKLLFNFINYSLVNEHLKKEFEIKHENAEISLKLPWFTNKHSEPVFDNNKFSEILIKNNWRLYSNCKITDFHENFIDWQKLLVYETWIKV